MAVYKKPLKFLGNSQENIQAFPKEVRRAAGAELLRVQLGAMPNDFKAMPDIGRGVYEIRIRLEGAWRVIYVAKFDAAVYVLHAFQKKTQKTVKSDIELARKHYKTLGD